MMASNPTRRVLLCILPLVLFGFSGVVAYGDAGVTITQKGTVFTFKHPDYRFEVDSAKGGAITSWKQVENSQDLIKPTAGLLNDLMIGANAYRADIMNPGPKDAILRLTRKLPSGFVVSKTIALKEGNSDVRVNYRIQNVHQSPIDWRVENSLALANPVSTDLAKNRVEIADSKTSVGLSFAASPDTSFSSDKGFVTIRFPSIPAGTQFDGTLVIASAKGKEGGAAPRLADRFTPLKDWINEAKRFSISEADKERGFWVSIGEKEGRQRVSNGMDVDLARNDGRYLALNVHFLRDPDSLKIDISEADRKYVTPYLEQFGYQRLELLPVPEGKPTFNAGTMARVWLRLEGGSEPGERSVPIRIQSGAQSETVMLHLKVWDATITSKRPFHVRGYTSGVEFMNGGPKIDEKSLRRLDTLFKAYAETGGDVLDWMVAARTVAAHATVGDTKETLASIVASDPTRIDLQALPDLDLSYFDPWLALARKHGIDRVETYTGLAAEKDRGWKFLDPLVGRGRVEIGSEDEARVSVWFLTQLRKYLESRGFSNHFCKIADEIGVNAIPRYIPAAKVAQEAGWRPFTTITGVMALAAGAINELNPYCDQWQIGAHSKDVFLGLLKRRYITRTQVIQFPPSNPEAGSYVNGGAVHTYGSHVFGPQGFTGIDPKSIEKIEVKEDGVPMRISTGSPWGNQKKGYVFTAGAYNTHLYLSPTGEAHPSAHQYELSVTTREESKDGEVLAKIDPTDELWYYGGGSQPFMASYESTWALPIMAPYQGFSGYGYWAFWFWQPTERIIWLNDDESDYTVSPAFCGYRDGWRDAVLFHELKQRHGPDAFTGVIGEEHAPLKVALNGEALLVANADDPVARNLARRRALERLSKSTSTALTSP